MPFLDKFVRRITGPPFATMQSTDIYDTSNLTEDNPNTAATSSSTTSEENSTPETTPPTIPALPELSAPDLLAVFTGDKSVRSGQDAPAIDIEQLDFLGRGILAFAIAASLFRRVSVEKLSTRQLEALRDMYGSDLTLSHWAKFYREFGSIVKLGIGESPVRRARLFSAYVGALYHQDGLEIPQRWLTDLVNYTHAVGLDAITTAIHAGASPQKPLPPQPSDDKTVPKKRRKDLDRPQEKRTKLTYDDPNEPTPLPESHTPTSVPTSSASTIPAPPAAAASSTKPSAVTTSNPKKFMTILNERVTAGRFGQLIWGFRAKGEPHMPEWNATLSIPKLALEVTGTASTKHAAREDAARIVCQSQGWVVTDPQ
ncbi:hypothetical protein FRB99_008636 [Tulasnella sp. 403]|nr:hypothetical protein FRB99_008636 [Tulasnella sp. 403]